MCACGDVVEMSRDSGGDGTEGGWAGFCREIAHPIRPVGGRDDGTDRGGTPASRTASHTRYGSNVTDLKHLGEGPEGPDLSRGLPSRCPCSRGAGVTYK